ncbi:hypothetical protein ENBRE01_1296 [Enteropsectra breve]|nr:hypothetical protein ENBRE01_1296 [Enteropsectra breve]
MNKTSFLKTIKLRKKSFHEYTKECVSSKMREMSSLVSLYFIGSEYKDKGIDDSLYSEIAHFSTQHSSEWAMELHRMRFAILDGMPYKANSGVVPILNRQANLVLVLAMLYGNAPIVSYFLKTGLVNINKSIFGSRHWPSYFLLSCVCAKQIFSECSKYWINYSIYWNRLSPFILSSLSGNELDKTSELDFLSYNQFFYINKYRGVTLANPKVNYPIFILDLACLLSDRKLIKKILEAAPEAGRLSRLSFIVQCEEHIILLLNRYTFNVDQEFNGNTPLHYCCYNNDFSTLSMLLYIGFPIKQDKNGRFPNEVGALATKEKMSVFFNFFTSIPQNCASGASARRIFDKILFKNNMHKWLNVMKFKAEDAAEYVGIFRYLDYNKENQIYKKSRFNIINIFGLSTTPSSIENTISRLMEMKFTCTSREDKTLFALFLHYFR